MLKMHVFLDQAVKVDQPNLCTHQADNQTADEDDCKCKRKRLEGPFHPLPSRAYPRFRLLPT
jgi:hypothetical protein